MGFRTVQDYKEYAAQMLHEDETDTVLAGSTSEGTHNLIDRWFKYAVGRVWSWHQWKFLTDTIDLTWSNSTTDTTGAPLYLPEYVGRILSVFPTTTTRSVQLINAYEFDRRRPNIRSRDVLVIHGLYGVEKDMGVAGTVTATSDAAADADDGLQIRIEGLTNATPARTQIETLTLSSSTATTTDTFRAGVGGVRRAYIVPGSLSTASGLITITGGGGTLEVLDASREFAHEHYRTELFAPLGGTGTYTIRYYYRAPDPANANDIVMVPEHFSDVIELLMIRELERFRGNYASVGGIMKEWRMRMSELRGWDNSAPGERRQLTVSRQWGRGTRLWRA